MSQLLVVVIAKPLKLFNWFNNYNKYHHHYELLLPFDMVEPFREVVQWVSDPDELVSLLTLLLVGEHHQPEDVSDGQVDAAFLLLVLAAVQQKTPKAFLLGLLLVNHGLEEKMFNKLKRQPNKYKEQYLRLNMPKMSFSWKFSKISLLIFRN